MLQFLSVQGESNPHRITAALSGAFGFIVLDLRQQACVLCIQNHPNNSRRNVLCSFFGADFRPDEALAAGNTWRILKANNEVWAYIRPIKTDAGSIPVGPATQFSFKAYYPLKNDQSQQKIKTGLICPHSPVPSKSGICSSPEDSTSCQKPHSMPRRCI